jgi:hypothetical protein
MINDTDTAMILNEERDFYLSCGCWSGDADHTCTKPGASRCRGCGVPDDCMCHEGCEGPGNRCYMCEDDARETRNEDHAEALAMLDTAPAFVHGIGWVPGDSQYPVTVVTEPWWWNRPESWEAQQHAAGRYVPGGW